MVNELLRCLGSVPDNVHQTTYEMYGNVVDVDAQSHRDGPADLPPGQQLQGMDEHQQKSDLSEAASSKNYG